MTTPEHARLKESSEPTAPWRRWGPYLSERQWGSAREDYSSDGNAWAYFTFDQSRSRAYKWGEDGIAGFSDDKMRLCFALALWNGHDPFLKERIFGLTNPEGNHGEDVKDYYFYLDSTPTHSYMKMLYKYPHAAFPYDELRGVNHERTRTDFEYELLDTGIFNDDAYFDVTVEFAKATPDDIFVNITVVNRGKQPAALEVLPHFWFRNFWWMGRQGDPPLIDTPSGDGDPIAVLAAHDTELGDRYLFCEHPAELLFTNNETNAYKLWSQPNTTPYVKDGINDHVVNQRPGAVNPERNGTKSAARFHLELAPGATQSIRLRLTDQAMHQGVNPFADFESVFASRKAEADEFYAAITPATLDADQTNVMRQGFAGMLWSKQTYLYDVYEWLDERDANPIDGGERMVRNREWYHAMHQDVISMPDKWEYPWFAAWDLAFHSVVFGAIDPDFAWHQLELMLNERYLHPNGQIPAYEWNFSDVNPPVHAWAALYHYWLDKRDRPEVAFDRLKYAFNKLMLNFSWWLNRKDRDGNNAFEGGFLGLDNIGVFDRSSPLPTGGHLEQADGTAWMALYSQNMLQIAIELATVDPSYEDLAMKYYEHFVWIASALNRVGPDNISMWDEEDGFFYDVLRLPDNSGMRLKVRSMVGLLPLCAVTVFEKDVVERMPRFVARTEWFGEKRWELFDKIHSPGMPGVNGRMLLAVLDDDELKRVLARMLDENEFLSDYGIRSLSRYHLAHPYEFDVHGQPFRVGYLPAESDTGMFGGNSNWRGPIWMPVNAMLIRSLLQMYEYYGDDFTVECPTGSGTMMTLYEVAEEIGRRLSSIFTRDASGKRAVYGGTQKFQSDPHWRDLVLFYEYFHGDNGAGLGASHQTGWTGLVASLIKLMGTMTPQMLLDSGNELTAEVFANV
jgi:hypothetical protein